jgi:hypothetical protein
LLIGMVLLSLASFQFNKDALLRIGV